MTERSTPCPMPGCGHRLRLHALLEGMAEPTLGCEEEGCRCTVTVARLEREGLWGGAGEFVSAQILRVQNGYVVEFVEGPQKSSRFVETNFGDVLDRLRRLLPRLSTVVDDNERLREELRKQGCSCQHFPGLQANDCALHGQM